MEQSCTHSESSPFEAIYPEVNSIPGKMNRDVHSQVIFPSHILESMFLGTQMGDRQTCVGLHCLHCYVLLISLGDLTVS